MCSVPHQDRREALCSVSAGGSLLPLVYVNVIHTGVKDVVSLKVCVCVCESETVFRCHHQQTLFWTLAISGYRPLE